MMEVRLILNDDYGQRNGGKAGVSKATDLTKDALTMFQWAIEEAAKGRVVLSSDSTGGGTFTAWQCPR